MTHRLAQGPAELVTKVKGEGDEGGQSVGGGGSHIVRRTSFHGNNDSVL